MDIKNQEWLEIFLWYRCNIKCDFCYQNDLRREFRNNIWKDYVFKLLKEWRNNKKEFVIFSGWEPTLDKNLPDYIKFSKELWYNNIRVHTNGWWFRNIDYLEDLYRKWLTWVTISIHWYWKVQDLISWIDWNFDYILRALINFEKLKIKDKSFIIDTNTVICRLNYNNLIILYKFLLKFSITRKMLTYPYNLKNDIFYLKKILPPKDDFLIEVEKLLEFINYKKVNDFVVESIPYCIINKKYWDYIEKNYKTNKDVFLLNSFSEWKMHYFIWKLKFDECKKCKKYDNCYWFSYNFISFYWKWYLNVIY